MSYFNRYRQYDSEGQVFHVPHGIRTPRSAKIFKKHVSSNKMSNFELPAGMFIAIVKDDTGTPIFRPLPHAIVSTAATTSSNRFKVKMPYMFVPGDVLTITAPVASITVASTALGTLTASGQTYTYTPTGAANPTEAAVKWAEYLNNTALKQDYTFLAAGTTLTVFENDLAKTSTLTPTGGLGTTAATTAKNTTPIGTIARIDNSTEEVVLNANASVALPVGYPVGVQIDTIYGVYGHAIVFNDYRDNMDIAVVHECCLKLSMLPFWSNYIKNYLPRVEAQDKY